MKGAREIKHSNSILKINIHVKKIKQQKAVVNKTIASFQNLD